MARLFRALVVALGLLALAACAGRNPPDPLEAMRDAGKSSSDGEVVGRWLLGELFAPGGDASRALLARRRLEDVAPKSKGMYASLARSIDDEIHGRFQNAASSAIDAISAARTDSNADAPMVAWFAANHLMNLRNGVQNLWPKARNLVLDALDHPGNLGWRGRSELVEWWSVDGFRDEKGGDTTTTGMLEGAAHRYGCAEHARMAGPFGHLAGSDHRTHYAAETPGPWPAVFPKDDRRIDPPRVLRVDRLGCALRAVNPSGNGIFYLETFIEVPADREVILAVQGAFALFVDDFEVLTRDTRQWGVWPRFGVHLHLEGGRHRLLARVGGPETSVRLLTAAGTPLDATTSDDPAAPYATEAPQQLPDLNVLTPFLTALGVAPQPGVPRPAAVRDVSDPIARVLASYLAHLEGQDDVASVLIEPLVKDPARATGPALTLQAAYFEKDPIFPQTDARDLAKDARTRASKKDGELWLPRFWLALDEAEKTGLPETAPKLQALADHFREVPEILKGLAAIYAKVGWKVEQATAVKEAAQRFPDDVEALTALLGLYDSEGRVVEADKLASRIQKLDVDSEVGFQRAVERRDYKAAMKELELLARARKDRRDISARLADLVNRAGRENESLEKLEAAVRKNPEDPGARLALADARLARGDKAALSNALVESIQKGADTGSLRDAIEIVDGIDELSAYRLDGRRIIAEFEKSKTAMPGTAARVLDYSAIAVHTDGSARMLEHEIIGIQSREGIEEHAEQKLPRGLVLKMRTLKKDGRILEPEFVEGKQTVTMPHLEVGDYVETESMVMLRGDGAGGKIFEGPRWFFREEKIPYWRSEFVVISPKTRPLDIETGGTGVPKPILSESGALVTRRWRVDKSPALPEEPASAPIQEFLPNVRIGWGISLKDTVDRLIDAAADETPRDPRLVRIAQTIGAGDKGGAAPASIDERARRIYRWVLSNVEQGREGDGRRIVVGKSGNRTEAFLYLARLSGIEAELGIVRDRLTAPFIGPMSESEEFSAVAVRLTTEKGPRWMLVRDKFAPYGYMPSSLRGQPAVILKPGAKREKTPAEGSSDGVTHEGTVDLAADGSAKIDLEQRYEGKLGIMLRNALESLPDARLKETIEARLLPQSFPGARILALQVKNLADVDAPLILQMKLEMSNFARPSPGELVISPPFPIHLGALAQLPERETPLYIAENIAARISVRLRIKLPPGARLAADPPRVRAEEDGRSVMVDDRIEKSGTLMLERSVDLPASRVQPEAYARFQTFARRADAALHRDVVIGLH